MAEKRRSIKKHECASKTSTFHEKLPCFQLSDNTGDPVDFVKWFLKSKNLAIHLTHT